MKSILLSAPSTRARLILTQPSLLKTKFFYDDVMQVLSLAPPFFLPKMGCPDITIIDPNPKMVDFMFQPEYINRYRKAELTVEVVSKTPITQEEKLSVGSLLQRISPQTAEALRNYRHDPGLFNPRLKQSQLD